MPFKNQHPLYSVWTSMRARCRDKRYKSWPDYGGRGITVCDRWQSFAAFVEDMGPRPEGYSLDRIDNDKGYSPDNCRWADRTTQQLNQRRAVYVVIDGTRHRAYDLAKRAGVKVDTIVSRAARGLPLEQVLSPTAIRPDYSAYAKDVAQRASATKRAKTECSAGHPFSPANTLTTKDGWRVCRICRNARLARRRDATRS